MFATRPMCFRNSGIYFSIWIAVLAIPADLAAMDEFGSVRPFFKTYCVECHNSHTDDKTPAFDTIDISILKRSEYEFWREVLHRVDQREMPPPDARQPNADELTRFKTQISALLRKATQFRKQRHAVIRRLNRRQYL